MSFSIDSKAFLVDLRHLEDEVRKDTKAAMHDAVEGAWAFAKGTVLFKDRTGALRQSVSRWAGVDEGQIVANSPYAQFVEAGTVPHTITGNQWLRFYWGPPNGPGAWVKFQSVRHPGTKPRPFMEIAGQHGEAALNHYLSEFTQESIRKFNSK